MSIRVSSLAVQIEAIGAEKVKAALRELGTDAERTSDRLATHYGKAARHLSLVTNEAVRAGEIGGNALQKILTIGGDMAGLFGISGAVVGALAVTGLAIYNYFDRARKAIEETAKAARAELRSLRDASAESAATTLNRIAGGDVLADNVIERKSIGQLQAERRQIAANSQVSVATAGGQTVTATSADALNKMKEIDDELARRNDLIRRGLPYLVATAEAEARRTIEEGKAGLASKAATQEQQRFNRELANLKDIGESAILNVNRIVEIQDKARATREKSGIREPGSVEHMAEDFASNVDVALIEWAKNNPFDWDAYWNARNDVATSTESLKPKIESPINQLGNQIRASISRTIGDAIYDGFSSAFSGKGLGGIFKGFGKTLLAGLGQIISEQGMIYLEYSGIMQAFTPLLGDPFTAGFAGAAIGAALIALGAALGAAAQGGGHSHSSASIPRPAEITNIKLTATSVADQARYDPRAMIHQTIIGPGDPVAFRQIQKGLDNNARRGG